MIVDCKAELSRVVDQNAAARGETEKGIPVQESTGGQTVHY